MGQICLKSIIIMNLTTRHFTNMRVQYLPFCPITNQPINLYNNINKVTQIVNLPQQTIVHTTIVHNNSTQLLIAYVRLTWLQHFFVFTISGHAIVAFGNNVTFSAKLESQVISIPTTGLCFSFYYYLHGDSPPIIALLVKKGKDISYFFDNICTQ